MATKALLSLLAHTAIKADSREMYHAIAKAANTEGLVLQSFDEAKKEIETDD
ncbi:MAG: hypothetical protein FWH05_05995 [Oscillospiraceae bacterium]|nr:hypothetical protein [Oscillospiraceae bacterium]